MRLEQRYSDEATLAALLERVVKGERGALARCLRLVDDVPRLGREVAARLGPHSKGARLIGMTGNPGAGKSTCVDQLVAHLRSQGERVAVLAVDPSSPFSGGAVLGDRIRMNRHFSDDDVFIRSMATRGAMGGLSRSSFDAARVLDAAGFDTIIVETVGVGQDEVDVVRLADTTVVVLVPGMGDDVQAIKAGILEVADIFLLNKSDREGVNDVERNLRYMMGLGAAAAWEPPIIRSVATRGVGMDALSDALGKHREFLLGPEGQRRRGLRAADLFERLLDGALIDQGRLRYGDQIAVQRAELLRTAGDAYSAVQQLLAAGPAA